MSFGADEESQNRLGKALSSEHAIEPARFDADAKAIRTDGLELQRLQQSIE